MDFVLRLLRLNFGSKHMFLWIRTMLWRYLKNISRDHLSPPSKLENGLKICMCFSLVASLEGLILNRVQGFMYNDILHNIFVIEINLKYHDTPNEEVG